MTEARADRFSAGLTAAWHEMDDISGAVFTALITNSGKQKWLASMRKSNLQTPTALSGRPQGKSRLFVCDG